MFNTLTRMGASAAGAYEIERSARFPGSDWNHYKRTFGTNSSTTTRTLSFWIKRSALGSYQTLFGTTNDGYMEGRLQFTSSDTLQYTDRDSSSGSTDVQLITNRVFRDVSAWMHIVFIQDTTDGTSGDRHRLYINGVEETSFSSETQPSQNYVPSFFRSSVENFIGSSVGSYAFNGYMTEIHYIDGAVKTPDKFGETNADTGEWVPKEYTEGSYGTNGFYLNFSDNSDATATTIGKDSSGQSNNFTPQNISVAAGVGNDSFIDTPTNNFCTMNPLTAQNTTVSNGALTIAPGGNNSGCFSTMQIPASGKWYFELTKNSGDPMIGYSHQPSLPRNWQYNNETDGLGTYFYGNRIECYHGGSTVLDVTDAPWNNDANGTVFGILWDRDNNTLKHRYNNGNEVSFTIPSDLQSLPLAFGYSVTTTWPAGNFTYNFGASGFAYTIPTGYKTLSSANLPDPTIKKGSDYFNTVLYTGNGGSSQTITGLDFSPNFVWFKERSGTQNHMVFDTVRGVENTLWPNGTWVEEAYSGEGVSAFNSNGVTIGDSGNLNVNSDTYVMWAWKEAATAGFDIVTYSGNGNATHNISHSLGVAPDLFIVKSRTNAQDWYAMHPDSGANKYLVFSGSGAQGTSTILWGNTLPTSSVFTVGESGGWATNESGENYVAYLFASVEGYSKIGTFKGNGSTNGPFVYTGFKPAYVLCKKSSGTDSWEVHDNKRVTYNPIDKSLIPDTNAAEGTGRDIDFLSNGFKQRNTNGNTNESGHTYIYLAFAESPFKYANAR